MSDRETLEVYARMAQDYADRISRAEPDGDLAAFVAALPRGDGPVLDWGCGPGNSAAIMGAQGLLVEATDAAPEMADLARELGIDVRIEPFEALTAEGSYRGIWANFALLHATPEAVPGHIAQAAKALRVGGILHLGMKSGTGSARDKLGRYFSYWTADALDAICTDHGLTPFATRLGKGMGLDGRIEPYVIHLSRK